MAVGLLAETESQTRRAAEVEVDPRPKMEKVGVEALSQICFSRLCSLQHRAQGRARMRHLREWEHSTGGVYQQKTEKVEVEVDPRPKMEKVGVEALSQIFSQTSHKRRPIPM